MEKIAEGARPEKSVAIGKERARGKANKIGVATPYNLGGGVLTPYGACYRWRRCGRRWSLCGCCARS